MRWARCGAIGWGTALQTRRSRVLFPMVLLEFFFDIIFLPHYDPEVDSASNGNECQEYFLGSKGGRCVGLITLPFSCADCHEIWEPQPRGTLRDSPVLYRDCCTTFFLSYEAVWFEIVQAITENSCRGYFASPWLKSRPLHRLLPVGILNPCANAGKSA